MRKETETICGLEMIKEFLDRKPLVSLFTRPRRFGGAVKNIVDTRESTQ